MNDDVKQYPIYDIVSYIVYEKDKNIDEQVKKLNDNQYLLSSCANIENIKNNKNVNVMFNNVYDLNNKLLLDNNKNIIKYDDNIIEKSNGEWLIIKLPNKIYLTSLNFIDFNIGLWRIYGSNDGINWGIINNASNTSYNYNNNYKFNLQSKNSELIIEGDIKEYIYFKLIIDDPYYPFERKNVYSKISFNKIYFNGTLNRCNNNINGNRCSSNLLTNKKFDYFYNVDNTFNFKEPNKINYLTNDTFDETKPYYICNVVNNTKTTPNCSLLTESPFFTNDELNIKCMPSIDNIKLPKDLKYATNNKIELKLTDYGFTTDFKAYCENKWYDWFIMPNYYLNNGYYNTENSNKDNIKKCYKPCGDDNTNTYNIIPYLSPKTTLSYCIHKDRAYNGLYKNTIAFTPLSLIFILGSNVYNQAKLYLDTLNQILEFKKDDYELYDTYENINQKGILKTNFRTQYLNIKNKIIKIINNILNDTDSEEDKKKAKLANLKNIASRDIKYLNYKSPELTEPDDNVIRMMEVNGLFNPVILNNCYIICRKFYDNQKLFTNESFNADYETNGDIQSKVNNVLFSIENTKSKSKNINIEFDNNVNFFNTDKLGGTINGDNYKRIINIFKRCTNICFSDKSHKFRKYIYDILVKEYGDKFKFDMNYTKFDKENSECQDNFYVCNNVCRIPDNTQSDKLTKLNVNTCLWEQDDSNDNVGPDGKIISNKYIDKSVINNKFDNDIITDKDPYILPNITTLINKMLVAFTIIIILYICYIFYTLFKEQILYVLNVLFIAIMYVWYYLLSIWGYPSADKKIIDMQNNYAERKLERLVSAIDRKKPNFIKQKKEEAEKKNKEV